MFFKWYSNQFHFISVTLVLMLHACKTDIRLPSFLRSAHGVQSLRSSPGQHHLPQQVTDWRWVFLFSMSVLHFSSPYKGISALSVLFGDRVWDSSNSRAKSFVGSVGVENLQGVFKYMIVSGLLKWSRWSRRQDEVVFCVSVIAFIWPQKLTYKC